MAPQHGMDSRGMPTRIPSRGRCGEYQDHWARLKQYERNSGTVCMQGRVTPIGDSRRERQGLCARPGVVEGVNCGGAGGNFANMRCAGATEEGVVSGGRVL